MFAAPRCRLIVACFVDDFLVLQNKLFLCAVAENFFPCRRAISNQLYSYRVCRRICTREYPNVAGTDWFDRRRTEPLIGSITCCPSFFHMPNGLVKRFGFAAAGI
jgi:hypothetical protein